MIHSSEGKPGYCKICAHPAAASRLRAALARRGDLNAREALDIAEGLGLSFVRQTWYSHLEHIGPGYVDKPPKASSKKPVSFEAKARSRTSSLNRENPDRVSYERVLEVVSSPCVVCGNPPPSSVDHVFPTALGGKNVDANLQPLCKPCNSAKGIKAPQGYYLAFIPLPGATPAHADAYQSWIEGLEQFVSERSWYQ